MWLHHGEHLYVMRLIVIFLLYSVYYLYYFYIVCVLKSHSHMFF